MKIHLTYWLIYHKGKEVLSSVINLYLLQELLGVYMMLTFLLCEY